MHVQRNEVMGGVRVVIGAEINSLLVKCKKLGFQFANDQESAIFRYMDMSKDSMLSPNGLTGGLGTRNQEGVLQ